MVVLYGAGVIGVPWFLFRLSRWEIWNMLRKFDQDVMGGVVSLAGSMLIAPVRYGKTPLPLFSEVGLAVAHG